MPILRRFASRSCFWELARVAQVASKGRASPMAVPSCSTSMALAPSALRGFIQKPFLAPFWADLGPKIEGKRVLKLVFYGFLTFFGLFRLRRPLFFKEYTVVDARSVAKIRKDAPLEKVCLLGGSLAASWGMAARMGNDMIWS